jgi:hypothetical protein
MFAEGETGATWSRADSRRRRIADTPQCEGDGSRKTLAQIGFFEATLFPELDYRAPHLRERWTHVRSMR